MKKNIKLRKYRWQVKYGMFFEHCSTVEGYTIYDVAKGFVILLEKQQTPYLESFSDPIVDFIAIVEEEGSLNKVYQVEEGMLIALYLEGYYTLDGIHKTQKIMKELILTKLV